MTNKTHFLYPSALFVNKNPYLITTILGSCVAVCFWDKYLKFGGMNHFMLPFWNGQGLASPKYGNIAIQKLYEKMQALGSQKQSIVVKIFGGAEIISTSITQFHIGKRNVEIARKLIEEYNLPVLSSSTGGNLGRKIIFNTHTGEVMHKFINNSSIQVS